MVDIFSARFAFEVLSPGPLAGGSGSESYLSVTGGSFVALLGKFGLAPGELSEYVSSLRGESWRDV
jgi:hypothetical protein